MSTVLLPLCCLPGGLLTVVRVAGEAVMLSSKIFVEEPLLLTRRAEKRWAVEVCGATTLSRAHPNSFGVTGRFTWLFVCFPLRFWHLRPICLDYFSDRENLRVQCLQRSPCTFDFVAVLLARRDLSEARARLESSTCVAAGRVYSFFTMALCTRGNLRLNIVWLPGFRRKLSLWLKVAAISKTHSQAGQTAPDR